PLLSRGWVYQEMALSRCVLHFSANELRWQCKQEAFCECGEAFTGSLFNNRDPMIKDTGGNSSLANIEAPSSELSLPQQSMDWALLWHKAVADYTALDLTKVSDRQWAILGIASYYEKRRDCRYLAGLWEGTLVLDLTGSL
ncbi:uncharacterized protein BDZ99DRAFT_360225, partial [Mytilinidion resinicola]